MMTGKEFDVNGFNTNSCTVTMRVSPLHGPLKNFGYPASIMGLVANLSFMNQTFDLLREKRTFPILYSGDMSSQQPGIDALQQRAQEDRLRTQFTVFPASSTAVRAGVIPLTPHRKSCMLFASGGFGRGNLPFISDREHQGLLFFVFRLLSVIYSLVSVIFFLLTTVLFCLFSAICPRLSLVGIWKQGM